MDPLNTDSEAIRRVIEAFETSSWSEIDVRVGSLRVHLRADGAGAAGSRPATVRSGEPHGSPEPVSTGPTPGEPLSESTVAEIADIADDAVLVRSPSPGIFWRSPQPGAPPFADVGQHVEANATVCIVEVMKLMNHVKAGVTGTVAWVFGHDGVAVDRGEPLFAVDTGDSAT